MSDNKNLEVKNEVKKTIKKPIKKQNKVKRIFKGIAVATLVATIAGGTHQIVYGTNDMKNAVTEAQLDDIAKREEMKKIESVTELDDRSKAADVISAGKVIEEYSDAEKIEEIKNTYINILKANIADTYGMEEENVSINSEDRTIDLNLSEKISITLYSQDFFRDGVLDTLPEQTWALIRGRTYSGEYNKAMEDLEGLDELKEKAEKGEITTGEIKNELKGIIQRSAILEQAKGKVKSYGDGLGMEHPKEPVKEEKQTDEMELSE